MRSTTPPTTPRVLPPYPQHALLFGALALGALVAGQPAAAENRASIGTSRSPQAAIGQLADADCAAALQGLFLDWDRAGFGTPAKPGQHLVPGRAGFVTSGPGYATLVAALRSASRATAAGCGREARAEIHRAGRLLARSRPFSDEPLLASASPEREGS